MQTDGHYLQLVTSLKISHCGVKEASAAYGLNAPVKVAPKRLRMDNITRLRRYLTSSDPVSARCSSHPLASSNHCCILHYTHLSALNLARYPCLSSDVRVMLVSSQSVPPCVILHCTLKDDNVEMQAQGRGAGSLLVTATVPASSTSQALDSIPRRSRIQETGKIVCRDQ